MAYKDKIVVKYCQKKKNLCFVTIITKFDPNTMKLKLVVQAVVVVVVVVVCTNEQKNCLWSTCGTKYSYQFCNENIRIIFK